MFGNQKSLFGCQVVIIAVVAVVVAVVAVVVAKIKEMNCENWRQNDALAEEAAAFVVVL